MKAIQSILALAVVLMLSLSVQNARAQIELTMGGGVNAPLGEYGDETNAGYAVSAGVGYRIMPLVVLGVEASYNGNNAPDEATASLGTGYHLSSSILQYSAVAKLVFPVGNHNVFTKGMVGNYRGAAKLSGPGGETSFSNTDLGYGVGAGFLINSASNSAFFADATYHHVAFDGSSGDTSFFDFTVGALFRIDLFKKDVRDDLQDELEKVRH